MFYANDEPEGKFLFTETIKFYCIALDDTLLRKDPDLSMFWLFTNLVPEETHREG